MENYNGPPQNLHPQRHQRAISDHFNIDVVKEDTEIAPSESGARAGDHNLAGWENLHQRRCRCAVSEHFNVDVVIECTKMPSTESSAAA